MVLSLLVEVVLKKTADVRQVDRIKDEILGQLTVMVGCIEKPKRCEAPA